MRKCEFVPRGVPYGAETPPAPAAAIHGATREPFEPDPGHAGAGTGTVTTAPAAPPRPGSPGYRRQEIADAERCLSSCHRRRHHRAATCLAQGVPAERTVSRAARGDAGDHAGQRRGTRAARLRSLRPLYRRRRGHRHPQGSAVAARPLDRQARRRRSLRRHAGACSVFDRGHPRRPPAAARQARPGADATGLRARRRRHPGDGIHRHPREHRPGAGGGSTARRRELRGCDPRGHDAGVRARRGGARPRDHPGQHQPPGNASR